jgi:serine/threonine protein kinase
MMSSSDMETTTLKITDFGLSKIVGGSTRAVTKLGTYSYMAPGTARCRSCSILGDAGAPFTPEFFQRL